MPRTACGARGSRSDAKVSSSSPGACISSARRVRCCSVCRAIRKSGCDAAARDDAEDGAVGLVDRRAAAVALARRLADDELVAALRLDRDVRAEAPDSRRSAVGLRQTVADARHRLTRERSTDVVAIELQG